MGLRFSIITPCLNAAARIEDAIRSVQAQDWPDFEHVVVDGGSTDGTVEILGKYPHVKWVSEPDGGPADALRKGFALSTGGVIGYLNAGDLYLDGAFAAVAPHFEAGEKFVLGQVKVRERRGAKTTESLNDPKSDFASLLRHWEPKAFCASPAGYFYTREVLEACPFNPDNAGEMDLEFLLEAASRFAFKKIDRPLGVFNLNPESETEKARAEPAYWWPERFPFLERFISRLPEAEHPRFRKQRDWGYQKRRKDAIEALLETPRALELIERGEIVPLPMQAGLLPDDRVVAFDRYAARGDSVIMLHQVGKVASTSIESSLESLPPHILPSYVFHTHNFNAKTLVPALSKDNWRQLSYDHAVAHFVGRNRARLRWNFVTLFRDPITIALSAFFEMVRASENHETSNKNRIPSNEDLKANVADSVLNYTLEYLDLEFAEFLGIDLFSFPFDRTRGYSIVELENNRVLLLKFEMLPDVFEEAMEAYWGLRGVALFRANITSEKSSVIAKAYSEARHTLRFDAAFLDRVYGHKVVRYFYTDAEIAQMRERWTEK